MDYPYDKKEDEGMFDLNTYSYLYDLACAKGDYADKIKILFGIEIGVQPHLACGAGAFLRPLLANPAGCAVLPAPVRPVAARPETGSGTSFLPDLTALQPLCTARGHCCPRESLS